MTSHTSSPSAANPKVKFALAGAERMSSLEIDDRPIVWDPDECMTALKATFDAMGMSPEERSRWAAAHPYYEVDLTDEEDFLAAQETEWFGERYEAHAGAVGDLHLERYGAIRRFLARHARQLIEAGLHWQLPTGRIEFDRPLIEALCAIRYERIGGLEEFNDLDGLAEVDDLDELGDIDEVGNLDETGDGENEDEEESIIFEMEDVLALRQRILGGSRVRYFKRTPYTGPESIVFDEDEEELYYENLEREDELYARPLGDLPPALLATALTVRQKAEGATEDEVRKAREYAAQFEVPDEFSDAEMMLFAWMAEDAPAELLPDFVLHGVRRVEAAHRFLRKNYEILEHRRLVMGDFAFSPALLEALDVLQDDDMSAEERQAALDLDDVLEWVEDAQAIRHAEDAVLKAEWRTHHPRNEPCPCGSGRKFKVCCIDEPPGLSEGTMVVADRSAEEPRLKELLGMLESFCETTAIATLTSDAPDPLVIDLTREEGGVRYGHAPGHGMLLRARLHHAAERGGSLILRSFTPLFDPESDLPIKEIRGFHIGHVEAGNFALEQLSPSEVRECFSVDFETGEPIEIEPAVVFR
jgi:hypothetical protein